MPILRLVRNHAHVRKRHCRTPPWLTQGEAAAGLVHAPSKDRFSHENKPLQASVPPSGKRISGGGCRAFSPKANTLDWRDHCRTRTEGEIHEEPVFSTRANRKVRRSNRTVQVFPGRGVAEGRQPRKSRAALGHSALQLPGRRLAQGGHRGGAAGIPRLTPRRVAARGSEVRYVAGSCSGFQGAEKPLSFTRRKEPGCPHSATGVTPGFSAKRPPSLPPSLPPTPCLRC